MSSLAIPRCAGLVALPLILAGCAGAPIIPALSAAASMQVEVEVYKGPLTLSRFAQLSDAAGAATAAEAALSQLCEQDAANTSEKDTSICNAAMTIFERVATNIRAVVDIHILEMSTARTTANNLRTACAKATPPVDCTEAISLLEKIADGKLQLADAPPQPFSESTVLDTILSKVQPQNSTVIEPLLRLPTARGPIANQVQASRYDKLIGMVFMDLSQIQSSASFLATESLRKDTARRLAARRRTAVAQTMADYASQIATRVELWNRQRNGEVADRMATGYYLRDSLPSEYLSLYDWYRTQDRAYQRDSDKLGSAARVGLARALFADRYWTKVNDVFASGQGEVRMALIKDDIGNWNLKSFDNDPEELLDAYRNVSMAGLQLATQIASGGDRTLLDIAGDFARGRVGAPSANVNLERALNESRSQTAAMLTDIKVKLTEQLRPFTEQETAAASGLAAAREAEKTAAQELDAARISESESRGAYNDRRRRPDATTEELESARQALDESTRVLNIAQDSHSNASRDLASAEAKVKSLEDARRAAGEHALERARVEIAAYRRSIGLLRSAVQEPAAGAVPKLLTPN